MSRRNESRYHIRADGSIDTCHARVGKCPFGANTPHFSSIDEAKEYINMVNEEKFGLIQIAKSARYQTFEDAIDNPKSLTSLVYNFFKSTSPTRRGYEYECFAAAMLAEENELDKTLIFSDKGMIGLGGELDNSMKAKVYASALGKLSQKYKDLGLNIGNEDALINVIHFSENSDTMIVQSGGPNVSDLAIINAEGEVSLVEVKKGHEGGSQIKSTKLETRSNGSVSVPTDVYPKEIQEQLEKFDITEAYGKNVDLKLTNKQAMEFFIDSYKDAGNSLLVITDRNGAMHKIDLTEPTSDIADRMIKSKMAAKITLRQNYGAQVLSAEKEERLDYYMNDYANKDLPVKLMPLRDDNNIRLGDLDWSKLDKSGKNTRLGEFILPVEWPETHKYDYMGDEGVELAKSEAWDPEMLISKSAIKVFPLVLTGEIKYRTD